MEEIPTDLRELECRNGVFNAAVAVRARLDGLLQVSTREKPQSRPKRESLGVRIHGHGVDDARMADLERHQIVLDRVANQDGVGRHTLEKALLDIAQCRGRGVHDLERDARVLGAVIYDRILRTHVLINDDLAQADSRMSEPSVACEARQTRPTFSSASTTVMRVSSTPFVVRHISQSSANRRGCVLVSVVGSAGLVETKSDAFGWSSSSGIPGRWHLYSVVSST